MGIQATRLPASIVKVTAPAPAQGRDTHESQIHTGGQRHTRWMNPVVLQPPNPLFGVSTAFPSPSVFFARGPV